MSSYRPVQPADRLYVLIPGGPLPSGFGDARSAKPDGGTFPAPGAVPGGFAPDRGPRAGTAGCVPAGYAQGCAPDAGYTAPSAARRAEEPWGFRRTLNAVGFALAASPLLQLAVSFAFSFLAVLLNMLWGFGRGMSNNDWQIAVTAVAYPVSFLLPVLLLRMTSRRPLPELLSVRPVRPVFLVSVPMTVLGTSILGALISTLIASVTASFGVVSSSSLVQPASGGVWDVLVYFVLIAVLPAFLEEFLFRGAVLTLLRPYGDGFAVLMSAAFFALIHCNLEQAPAAFLTGLALGCSVIFSGSVWPAVLAHFINNGLSCAAGLIFSGLSSFEATLANLILYAFCLLAGALGCVILFRRRRPGMELAVPGSGGRLLRTAASRPGVLLFLVVCGLLTAASFHVYG